MRGYQYTGLFNKNVNKGQGSSSSPYPNRWFQEDINCNVHMQTGNRACKSYNWVAIMGISGDRRASK